MSLNSAQILSSPQPAQRAVATANDDQTRPEEMECWKICRDRFKYVILLSIFIQYLLLMIYSILLNYSFLHPYTWAKEMFVVLCSPMMLATVVHGYFNLKPLIDEKVYQPTRFSKFVKSFGHESSIFFLNFFIGLFTSLLFVRYLNDDFKSLTLRTEEKKFLNERFAFLIFNGAFIRCYLYFKRRDFEQSISFPLIHQSKFLQVRRQIITVIKSSFVKSLLPTIHFVGFYIIFGGSFSFMLRPVFGLQAQESSMIERFTFILNMRLLIYSWIFSSLIWSNMELMGNIINIFASQPKQFPIEGSGQLTLTEALSITKFQITQQLAAQDLNTLSESPNNIRRKQFYALSNPGGHPHNWKHLIQKSLEIINKFTDELKQTVELQKPTVNNNINQSFYNFYESKRLAREYNEFSGIRSLATASLKYEPASIEKQSDVITAAKKRLLANRFIFYCFGEDDGAKLNFLLSKNTQPIIWIVQGITALIARSLDEDSYGVVQHDIKQVLKSIIKLKNLLDKVGAVNAPSVTRDKNFLSMKAAVRRSLYRVSVEFSRYFDDLLLDPEDIRSLHSFVTFREL